MLLVWLCKYRNKYLMQKYPLTTAAMKPKAKGINSELVMAPDFISEKMLYRLSKPAPATIGAAKRKEKRAATSRFRPTANPPVMVLPERETPGKTAIAWEKPIISVSLTDSRSNPLECRAYLSTRKRIAPNKIIMIAIRMMA